MPIVSVIVPCYNQGCYLQECLESIFSNDYPNFEVVIVDDGSTDHESLKALDAISDPRVMIIRKKNEGVAIARNTAIAAARGKYILPLDADDKIGPGFIAKAVAILEKDAKVGVVSCEVARFGAETGPIKLPKFSPKLMLMANVVVCTAVFRRADWERFGGVSREYGLRLGGLGFLVVVRRAEAQVRPYPRNDVFLSLARHHTQFGDDTQFGEGEGDASATRRESCRTVCAPSGLSRVLARRSPLLASFHGEVVRETTESPSSEEISRSNRFTRNGNRLKLAELE